jgi:Zn-dependent M28 family amino/carboxypeptidase
MAYLSSTGEFVDAPIEPRLARAADYRANRYHQAADEWEADWDYSGMLQDLDVMFKVGQDLANSRTWPEWKSGSEFGPERAKSAAQRR